MRRSLRSRSLASIAFGVSLILVSLAAAQRIEIPIPAGNRRSLRQAPPRPGPGNIEEKARTLFAAILADDPEAGKPFFMPREIFHAIKGVADPDRFYSQMLRLWDRDVHALHETIPEGAEYVRFEFSRRRGWVELRQESNRLPYWAQRHNHIVYTVDGEERRFEVRTMIAWGDEWFITHLSEFRNR